MNNPFLKLTLLIIAFTLAVESQAADTRFYRYKDASGKMVIGSTLPTDQSGKGYEIINTKGRVLETVKPQLTKEELDLMAQKDREAMDAKSAAEKQKAYDDALLLRYSFATDIESEKKRKIDELNVSVSIFKGNAKTAREALEKEYAAAAEFEHKKKPVPDDIKDRIKTIEAQVITIENLYKTRKDEISKLSADYDKAISRFKEIERLKREKLNQQTPSSTPLPTSPTP